MNKQAFKKQVLGRAWLAAGVLCAAVAAQTGARADLDVSVGGGVTIQLPDPLSKPAPTNADSLPKVRLITPDPFALAPSTSGAFTLLRNGQTTNELTVTLTIGGSALNGVDYQTISTNVTIPTGFAAVDILVQPLASAPASIHDKTVELKLNSSSNYTIISKSRATVTIVEEDFNNTPPKVSITSPTNGAIISGALVTIDADAESGSTNDPIAKVSFFSGDFFLGTSTNAPYSIVWTNVGPGKHVLFARAVDKLGQVGLSDPVTIQVTNSLPFINITNPPDGAVVPPGNVSIGAETGDGESTITNVSFYANGHLLGSLSAPPFTLTWSNAAPGHYELVATAQDLLGNMAESPEVHIFVSNAPPVVSLTSPTNGATFGPTNAVILAADASDSDDSVKKVDFYVDDHLVGSVTNSPYSVTWAHPTAGNHVAIARAVDSFGAQALSKAVKFSVTNSLPTISLTSPTNNAVFPEKSDITFTADASDSGGTITKVTFWANDRLIGTATTAPYTVTWTNAPAGQYIIDAHAVDSAGDRVFSDPILITVSHPHGKGLIRPATY
jgi:hypothetical protein